MRRTGAVLAGIEGDARKALAERFWAKVHHEPNTGCFIWGGSEMGGGYGNFTVRRKSVKASRVAYELAHGPIPSGEGWHGVCVMHKCDVRICVNPDHLILGTHAENMADRNRKGRAARLAGEKHGCARLSWEQVREMRAAYAAGGVSYEDLMRRFDVSKPTVAGVITRRYWRDHVEP